MIFGPQSYNPADVKRYNDIIAEMRRRRRMEQLGQMLSGAVRWGWGNLTNRGRWDDTPAEWIQRGHPGFQPSIYAGNREVPALAEVPNRRTAVEIVRGSLSGKVGVPTGKTKKTPWGEVLHEVEVAGKPRFYKEGSFSPTQKPVSRAAREKPASDVQESSSVITDAPVLITKGTHRGKIGYRTGKTKETPGGDTLYEISHEGGTGFYSQRSLEQQ